MKTNQNANKIIWVLQVYVYIDFCISSCSFHTLTCRHKEDSWTEDDIVTGLVELAGSYTQATHEEQDDAEDGEDTRRSYGSYRWREREKKVGWV